MLPLSPKVKRKSWTWSARPCKLSLTHSSSFVLLNLPLHSLNNILRAPVAGPVANSSCCAVSLCGWLIPYTFSLPRYFWPTHQSSAHLIFPCLQGSFLDPPVGIQLSCKTLVNHIQPSLIKHQIFKLFDYLWLIIVTIWIIVQQVFVSLTVPLWAGCTSHSI